MCLQLESAISEHCEGERNADPTSVLSVALKTELPVYFSRLEEARMKHEGKQAHDVERRMITVDAFFFHQIFGTCMAHLLDSLPRHDGVSSVDKEGMFLFFVLGC